jgi:radical SAM superfamily enzyme YgiQ (UPF0313 family)
MLKIGFLQATGQDHRTYGTPLSFGYILSVLQRDWEGSFESRVADTPEELIAWEADLIGIGSVTSCFGQAEQYVQLLRNRLPAARIVLGGHHISALPHRLPAGVDVGVIGEGEYTFLDLVRRLQPGRCWPQEELADIPGICHHKPDGSVAINAERPRLSDLDRLPFPLRTPNPCAPHEAILFTSRGCPFHCRYCSTHRYWAGHRRFSAEYVVAELESIVRDFPDVNSVRILDDLYVADRKRLREMVRLIRERGLHQRLRFHGFVRSSLVDEDLCGLLVAMNVNAIRFGAESGSDAVLRLMEKGGKCSVATHQRAIDLAARYGMECSASFMFGYPGETRANLQETIDFIRGNESRLAIEGFYLAVPLPGTELWTWAEERGLVSETMDFSRLNLAFDSPSFEWGDFLYLNDDTLPRDEFVRRIRESGLLSADRQRQRMTAQTEQALRRLQLVLPDLAARGVHRIALYGAGEHTRRLLEHLPQLRPPIVAILDDASPPRAARLGTLPVHHPREAVNLGVDAVIISSDCWEADIWARRSIIERHGISVHRLYGEAQQQVGARSHAVVTEN